MELILKNVKKKDFAVLKSLSKALGFVIEEKITTSESELATQKPYNPEFVKEILDAEQSIRDGKGVRIKLEDLWK